MIRLRAIRAPGGVMPTARLASVTGPLDLYYEETGQGFPLIWCHEYGGDYRSWEHTP
jgi:hypothetical protein